MYPKPNTPNWPLKGYPPPKYPVEDRFRNFMEDLGFKFFMLAVIFLACYALGLGAFNIFSLFV